MPSTFPLPPAALILTASNAITLVDVHIDLDLRRLNILALLDTRVAIWRSRQRLVSDFLLELFVAATLAEFVDSGVVDLRSVSVSI